MENCLFCKIARGEIPAKVAYEDERVFCFHDINPGAPVHVLIIPREHIASVDGINADNADVIAHIFRVIPKISASLGLENGYRVVSNCGPDACQSVPHLHFHILGGAKLQDSMG